MLDTLITAVESDGEGLDVGRVTGFMNKVSFCSFFVLWRRGRVVLLEPKLTSTRLVRSSFSLRSDNSSNNHLSGSIFFFPYLLSITSSWLGCLFGSSFAFRRAALPLSLVC